MCAVLRVRVCMHRTAWRLYGIWQPQIFVRTCELVALCESYDVTHAWPLAYMAHAYGLWHMHVCMHLRFWGNFACFCTQTCSKYLLYINQCMHVDGHVLSHARHMHSANKGQETCHTFSYAHLRMLCACTHSARGCHFLLIRPHCAFAPKTYAFPSWF